jgi:hypothetical protein
MTKTTVLILVLSFILACRAEAYRREYNVTLDGHRKPGSEVCFFRGVPGSAFTLYFSDPDVVCLPADQVMDFPPGTFFAFARNHEGFVSSFRDRFTYSEPAIPEGGYELLETPLEKAGVIDVSAVIRKLQPGQKIGVLTMPTPERLGTYFPLVTGESTILVPAETQFVVLLSARGLPVAASSTRYLAAGERQTVTELNSRALVICTKVDLQGQHVSPDMPAAEVTVKSHGKIFKPLAPLFNATDSNELLFFSDVPPGEAELRIAGRYWQRQTVHVPVESAVLTVRAEPVTAKVGGAIEITWNAGEKDGATTTCGSSTPSDADPVRLTVESCDLKKNIKEQKCTMIGTRLADFADGIATIEGASPGTVRVTSILPGRPSRVDLIEVAAGRSTALHVPNDVFKLFGTVTLQGKPIEAKLIFSTGESRSDSRGSYSATLSADPKSNIVEVIPCSTGRAIDYVPHQPVIENSRYDLSLDTRQLEVTVVDRGNNPVSGVEVVFGAIKKLASEEDTQLFYRSPSRVSNEAGRVTMADVPTNEKVLICGSHPSLSKTCSDPVSVGDLSDNSFTLVMGASAIHGRVVNHQGTGTIALVSWEGQIIEDVLVAPDGTFSLKSAPVASSYFVYTSDRRPLSAFPLPLNWDQPSSLNFVASTTSAAPIHVHISGEGKRGYVGLWVGDLYVPLQVLAREEDYRGNDIVAMPGQTVTIADIAASAPLFVAFAPQKEGAVFVDVFTLPEYRTLRRTAVIGDTVNVASP